MTLIEFFEKDAIENICSSLLEPPDRVIMIGDNLKLIRRYAENYKIILSERGMDVEFICQAVNRNNIQSIINALCSVVEQYENCVFDLTGGEDLYLVAAGIVLERYKNKNIQMHRFNVRNNKISDVDQDGNTILEYNAPLLSIEENIRIHGGGIVYEEQREDATRRWDMNDDFKRDINSIWNICRHDVRLWNAQIGVFEAAQKLSGNSGLTVNVPTEQLKETLQSNGGKYFVIRKIFEELRCAGLLTNYSYNEDLFSVTYKNEQVKRCLTVAGQALEMKVFLAALEATETDGTVTYNDVMNGVFIDWDGEIHTDRQSYDTENEIDVIMMHGMVPVFVSCKNGNIEKEELYKLNSVATRFGGKYAKKVLVATALDNSSSSNYLRQRARDMGIRLVEGYSHNGKYKDFVDMNDVEINRMIRSLWSN